MDSEDKNQKPNLSPPSNLPSVPPPFSPGRSLPPTPPVPPSLPSPPKISPTPSPVLPPRLPNEPSSKPEPDRPVVDIPKTPDSKNPTPQKSVPESFGGFGSSIRTMQGDIDSILKGKKPEGEIFEKKMEGAIKAPPPPPPLPPSPATPKGPLVKLGETEKAKPIAPVFAPRLLPIPKPEEKKIAIPPPGKAIISKPIILLLALIVAAGGFSYWFFIFRQPEPEAPIVEVTPTPTLTPAPFESPAPVVEEKLVINLGGDPFGQLSDFVNNTFVGVGEIKVVDAVDQLGKDYNFNTFFQSFLINLPQDIISNLDIDNFKFLLFGQTENFGSKVINKRYGFVVEVVSEINLTQGLKNWEPAMADNVKVILNLNIATPQTADFQDNIYKDVAMRYKNFPFPDETIDYAVISGTNGKKYFVFVNSREGIYSVIDKFDSLILPFLKSSTLPPPLTP